jgi:hypothetical protein
VSIAFSAPATLSLTNDPVLREAASNLTAYADRGGVVVVQPMKRTYSIGEQVALKAVPLSTSFAFIGWAGDMDGLGDERTLIMDANKTVRARFATATPIPPGCVRFWAGGETDVSGFGALEYIVRNFSTSFVRGRQQVTRLVTPLGKVGGAFEFDGTDGAAFISSDETELASITLEAWVFRDVTLALDETIVAKGAVVGEGQPVWSLGLLNGCATFKSRHRGSAPSVLVSPSPILFSVWTHLAATFDGTTRRIFVDGAEVIARAAPGALDYEHSSGIVTIGMRCVSEDVGTAVDCFIGRIDELAIYDRALTQNEVADIYGADIKGKNVSVPYFTSSSALPAAAVGSAYAQTLRAILPGRPRLSEPPPLIFSFAAGLLPPGIVLSPSDGTLSGIPTFRGTFDFVVRCTDEAGGFTDQLFVVPVS